MSLDLAPGVTVLIEPSNMPTLVMAPPLSTTVAVLPVVGPPGPPGPPGGEVFRYDQTLASTVWLIDHDLGRYPAVVALYMPDLSEQYREYKVQHLSVNSLRVSMDIPTIGVALVI